MFNTHSKINPQYTTSSLIALTRKKTSETSLASYQEQRSDYMFHNYCQICCEQSPQLMSICHCEHKYCFKCCLLYTSEKVKEFNEIKCPSEYCDVEICIEQQTEGDCCFYSSLIGRQKQKIMRFLERYDEYKKNPKKCQQCRYLDETKTQKLKLCPSCTQIELALPQNIKRCPQCQRLLEKNKGCNHMTCPCGSQFCFNCRQSWSESHICTSRLANRTGIQFILHIIFKVIISIPLLVLIVGGLLMFILFICNLSAFLAGLLLFLRLITVIKDSQMPNCAKFGAIIAIFIILPVIQILCLVPGFIMPLINICYEQNIIMDPKIVINFAIKLFSCFKVLMII